MKTLVFPEKLFLCFLGSLLLMSSCKKDFLDNGKEDPVVPVIISTEIYQQQIIDSANQFAFDLFKPLLAGTDEKVNIMISPFSISTALSMTLNGAEGETFEAMMKTLRLDGKTLEQINSTYLKLMTEMISVDQKVILNIANSVWIDKQLTCKQSFIDDLVTWYKSEAKSIDVTDPGAVKTVNDWIAASTQNKITEMLDKFDEGTRMLLINAIYFNGKWSSKFDISETKQESFYTGASEPETVAMMHQMHEFKVVKNNSVSVVELPYGRGNYTMVIVLPDENLTSEEMANVLSLSKWNEWMNENTKGNIVLALPRFKYNYKRDLKDDLTALGMGIAFTTSADFSRISNQSLMIEKVLHQSFIDTNEDGSEAAAATVVEMANGAAEPIVVKADHPFLYFIRESSTGTIIFMGRVSDPLAS